MATRAVIFDIDGTLLDSVDFHAQAWQEAFAHFGREFPFDKVRGQIGKGGDQLLPVFLSTGERLAFDKDLEEYRSKLFKEKYLPKVRPFPRVRDLFERLRADGKRIALASSGKADEVEKYQEIAGIADLIDDHTSSDDASRSKPHPDIFEAALEKLGDIDPATALVVGDTPYDAEAAVKAGLRVVGVLCGGFPEEELRGAGCFAIYQDPADLLARYDESPLHRN